MKLLAIDPGADAGIAIFVEERLVAAKLLHDKDSINEAIDRVVCEMPQAYGRCDPNDLIKLAFRAGRLSSCVPWKNVQLVRPVSWKVNVTDLVLYNRILSKLNPNEQGVIADMLKRHPKSKAHNVLDAIGIGLYALGRMGPGGV